MKRPVFFLIPLLLAPNLWAALPEVNCDGESACREQATGLALLVLPRSFSHLYADRELKQVAQENLPAFQPLFVFARELPAAGQGDLLVQGRYQVGTAEKGPPLGWMAAGDLLEWRQALIAAFTHPGSGEEARQRVLMFPRLEDLETLVDEDERELNSLKLYDRIDSGEIPPEVSSKEPEAFVDIGQDFYLLPVVDYRLLDLDGDELRLVRLASALPGERADPERPDRLDNPGYRRQAAQQRPDPERIASLGVDLVFVMDMTRSMQPYLDRTKAAVAAIAEGVAKAGLEERLRFGLVGFRDDVEKAPDLEFTRRNFTPALVDGPAFAKLLEDDAKAASVSSPGYSEEVFAGVEEGLDSAWRDNSLKVLVLVGDASGHPPDHPQSTTKKDAKVLRMAAQDRQVHILAIQLLNPKFPEDQALAEAQFGELAKERASGQAVLLQVRTDAEDDYRQAVERSVANLVALIETAGTAYADGLPPEVAAEPNDDSIGAQADQVMQRLIRSAMVEYLGQDAKPPRDLLIWAADRDLTNPSIRSLEVRVLLTREQLSDLILALERILAAMQEASISNLDFFDALQGLAAQSLKRPDDIARVDGLRQSGLVPSFIESLPYVSEVLALNRDSYASLTAEQRADLNQRLLAKLSQYRKINETVDGWTPLNPQAEGGRRVYPLQLDYLP